MGDSKLHACLPQASPTPRRRSVYRRVLLVSTALGLSTSLHSQAEAQYYSETRAAQATDEAHADGQKHSRSLDTAFSNHRTVADELERMPEVRVRRSGSGSAPAYISIRASESNAVAIYLEGIPLNGGHQSSVSLNMVLPELLQSAEVYRSNAPLALGANLPGGAVNLRLRDAREPGVAASIGGGSFGSGKLGVMGTHRGEDSRTLVALAWRGSRGDFTFFNNNGTDFNLNDDNPRERRVNNHSHEGSLLFHHEQRMEKWRLTLFGLTDVQRFGVPGLDVMQSKTTNGQSYSQLLAFNADRRGLQNGALDLALQSSVKVQRDLYDDRKGEVGYGNQDRSTGQLIGQVAAQASWWLPRNHSLRLRFDLRGETYTPRDRITELALHSASRTSPQLSAGWAWHTDNRLLALDASVRSVHWVERSRGTSTPSLQLGRNQDHLVGAQFGAVLTPLDTHNQRLRIFTYASRTGRAPDFDERFGNNGSSTGNPALLPETQWQYELGVSDTLRLKNTEIHGQVTGYTQWRTDAIEYISNPIGIRTPLNMAGARVSGIEASLRIDARYAGGNLSLTRLWTKSEADNPSMRGKQLPWRSEWSADGTLYAAFRGARIEWTSAWDSPFFADARNRRVYPERWLHDLTVSYRPEAYARIEFSLELRNITNERVRSTEIRNGSNNIDVPRAIADYRGFPLPGRAIYATVTWRGPLANQEAQP